MDSTAPDRSAPPEPHAAPPVAPGPSAAPLHLRLLATTDLHGYLRAYDYIRSAPRADVGLSRVARLIAAARAEVPNTLLFDNGDTLQGTALTDYWGQKRGLGPGEVHPMIRAMNALGYDAATPGNHDFNFGLPFLMRALEDARFPVVCANALRRTGPQARPDSLLAPWTILERRFPDAAGQHHSLRIGVIGFLPPQTANWDRLLLEGQIETRAILKTAHALVPVLRAAGADLVIALAHTGIAPPAPGNGETTALSDRLGAAQSSLQGGADDDEPEDAGLSLAMVPGLDALICGHSHLTFPPFCQDGTAPGDANADKAVSGDLEARADICRQGRLHGTPAVMPGRWGSHLGVIDITLDPLPPPGAGQAALPQAGPGVPALPCGPRWRIREARAELRPVSVPEGGGTQRALVDEDPQIVALSEEAHQEVLSLLRRPIGQSEVALTSFFAMVAPDRVIDLLARIKKDFVRRQLHGQPEAALPLLASVSPKKCGGRGGPGYFTAIPSGPLTVGHMFDLYTFPNLIAAVRVSGAQIVQWLEFSAGAFARLRRGARDQPLLDPDFPPYNFDVLHGLSYEIDPTVPPRYAPDGHLINPSSRRIRNLRHGGAPVTAQAEFIVATNSFRVWRLPGGGAGGRIVPLGPRVSLRALLLDAFGGPAADQPDPDHDGQTGPNHLLPPGPAQPVWRFPPLPGTSAWFETSPLAQAGPDIAPGMQMEDMGLTATGFRKIRLNF